MEKDAKEEAAAHEHGREYKNVRLVSGM